MLASLISSYVGPSLGGEKEKKELPLIILLISIRLRINAWWSNLRIRFEQCTVLLLLVKLDGCLLESEANKIY